tara:strand:- start:186 stop:362 length:177 start_codon:yes stop_codon:yes gene_type:complete
MSKKYTQEQIIDACIHEIDSWDMETLVNYAYDNLTDYYLDFADAEEVELFIQGENVNV